MKIIKLNIMILLIILFSLSIFPVHTYGLFDDGKQSSEINKKEEIMNKIENVYYKYKLAIHFYSGFLSCINFILFCIEILKKSLKSKYFNKKFQILFFVLSILFLIIFVYSYTPWLFNV